MTAPPARLRLQVVRRDGDGLTVAIPDEAAAQLGIVERDFVDVSVEAAYRRHAMGPELRAAFERVWQENEAGFRYLASHD